MMCLQFCRLMKIPVDGFTEYVTPTTQCTQYKKNANNIAFCVSQENESHTAWNNLGLIIFL